VNSRELELSLNEDYRTVDTERKDLVTYTTTPLAKDIEITGPMTATLWAVTEGKDTDWNSWCSTSIRTGGQSASRTA